VDIATLIDKIKREGRYRTIATNPRAQFGTPNRRYKGAELLPEQTVPDNAYRETAIRYRTIVANDGTRYSPTQLKGGEMVGDFLVELAESDIKREFTAREYDALIAYLMRGDDMEALLAVTDWLDITVNLALAEKNEVMRWQAIEKAVVERRGFNNFHEDVAISNPTGHRVVAAGTWSNDTYDPFQDIYAVAQVLIDKGYMVSRMITSRRVVNILSGNAKVAQRSGRLIVSAGGNAQLTGDRATLTSINAALSAEDLPPLETYDLQYRTETGFKRFISNDVLIFIATTGRDVEIDLGDDEPMFLPNTLGYTGIGRPAGQSQPGRVIRSELHESKPPRIEGEGWQTSFPVILDPEAVAVIKTIS
jgi:hypothetical protein